MVRVPRSAIGFEPWRQVRLLAQGRRADLQLLGITEHLLVPGSVIFGAIGARAKLSCTAS